jgi:hypothetical protein
MRILARLPRREIEGADEVLEGFVGEFASGNQCRIWPAMTYDREANQTRIAFFTEWRRVATPDDIAELTAYTDELMGKPPELLTETNADPCAEQENVEWLRTGKRPVPRRSN